MSNPKAMAILTIYELRKAMARKRIILLIALIFLTEAALYLILALLPPQFVQPFKSYAWIVGIIVPSTVLIHILALTIGAAAFSEEYEMGTADFWLTRPITRAEYFAGKVFGSLVFTAAIVSTYSILSLILSWWIFGPQSRLELFVSGAAASIFSSLTFLSVGLVVGELLRRSMLATILAATGFFTSFIIETYLGLVSALTGDQSLAEYATYLPSWAASRLTATIISNGLGVGAIPLPFFASGTTQAEILTAALNITAYSTALLMVTLIRLTTTDITRRAA
ncbi:MAG: ABC transporter permease [Nitrososphaerota archaeon]|nr:ABC transporter permease [Candidatus Calditenuaceae archaeon]MDW8073624.1 ABC transporter permease [Nitrososphaerota archaeon]